jgi:hypothetical protein
MNLLFSKITTSASTNKSMSLAITAYFAPRPNFT